MPYKDRQRHAEYVREWRAKRRVVPKPATVPPPPDDPVGELVRWSRDALKVPVGHPLAGQPMEMPEYIADFLREGWGAHESACTVARKNAKSAGCAILCLGFLCGPLRVKGWRGAIASLSKEKANELKDQVEAIAVASGLDELEFRRSPYPGKVISETGTLETLASDRKAGHASSYDLVVVDETGLFRDNARELLAGLRSSVSAKNGRIVHISVRGDSDLFREVLENPETVAHVHEAPSDADLFDREAWRKGNPTLGTIKSVAYMEAEARRVTHAPSDEPSFRAFDMNARLDPTREMILLPSDLQECFADELPERRGPCVLGMDAGEATSATAACAIWPRTGRLETWMAFGSVPKLIDRGRKDGAPYVAMHDRGELRLYDGRVVPLAEFLSDVAGSLNGSQVARFASDGYKDKETMDFLDRAKLPWQYESRRVGAGKDGSSDLRSFQRLVLTKKLFMANNLSLVKAIESSEVRRDENGNPALNKAKAKGRIDVLSAAIIAAGLAEPLIGRQSRTRRRTRVI